jgi:hypothetical protein
VVNPELAADPRRLPKAPDWVGSQDVGSHGWLPFSQRPDVQVMHLSHLGNGIEGIAELFHVDHFGSAFHDNMDAVSEDPDGGAGDDDSEEEGAAGVHEVDVGAVQGLRDEDAQGHQHNAQALNQVPDDVRSSCPHVGAVLRVNVRQVLRLP